MEEQNIETEGRKASPCRLDNKIKVFSFPSLSEQIKENSAWKNKPSFYFLKGHH